MNKKTSKIELAKALKGIKAVSSKEKYQQLLESFLDIYGKDELSNAIQGLSEEDEFALLTTLMRTASQIVGFEQRPLIKGDYIVPDFFMNFPKTKTTCLIDVKSTKDMKYKIGGSYLRRLRNFSDVLGHPLYIAVRFVRAKKHAMWAIVKDTDRSRTTIHVEINDMINGERKNLWQEYILTPSPKMIVMAKFSKKAPSDSIHHDEIGSLIELIVSDSFNTINFQNPQASMVCGFLESYGLDVLKTEEIDDDLTMQYLQPTIFTSFLADIVYQVNRLVVDDDGSIVYDASKLLAHSDVGSCDDLIDRYAIEHIVQPLIDKNLLFIGAIGKP